METCFAITSWARAYKWTARLLWIIAYFSLAGLSLLTGILSGLAHGELPVACFVALLLAAAGIALYYPRRKNHPSPLLFSARRIRFDFALYTLLAFAWLWTGNQLVSTQTSHYQEFSHSKISIIEASTLSTTKPQDRSVLDNAKKKSPRKSWKKKAERKLAKVNSWWSKIRSWKRGYQFLFFIGISFFAFILALVLAIISCQLACTGSGLLAIAVFLMGFFVFLSSLSLFVYAFVALVRERGSSHKSSKEAKEEVNS